MSNRAKFHVVPTGRGDWGVKKQGADRASKTFEDKKDAVERRHVIWKANLQGSLFEKATLKGAVFAGADLRKAQGLTVDQLSEVLTLYKTKLDPELERELKIKSPHLFKELHD